jgi:hypothetical protein
MNRREAAGWSAVGTHPPAEVGQSRQVPASRNVGRPDGNINGDGEAKRPRPRVSLNRSMLATTNVDPLRAFM